MPPVNAKEPMEKVILVLTPLAACNDSRTLKLASSFIRRQFRCVIMENVEDTTGNKIAGAEYVHLWPTPKIAGPAKSDAMQSGLVHRNNIVLFFLHLLRFVTAYWIVRPLVGVFSLPRCDVIYLHEYRLFPLAWIIAKRDGAKLVYDAHDLYTHLDVERDSGFLWWHLFRPVVGFMEKCAAKFADIVVVTSPAHGEYLRRFLSHEPLVIRNCHDERLDQFPEKTIRQTLAIADDEQLIVSIGHRKRGQLLRPFLMAQRDFQPTLHSAFIGRGYEDDFADVVDLNLEGRVHFLGPLQTEQIVPSIRDADAAVLLYTPHALNYDTKLPNGLFQALAAGLRLIYPPLEQISVVASAHNGVVADPTSEKELAEALSVVLRQENPIQITGSGDISWSTEEEKLFDALDVLLASGSAGNGTRIR